MLLLNVAMPTQCDGYNRHKNLRKCGVTPWSKPGSQHRHSCVRNVELLTEQHSYTCVQTQGGVIMGACLGCLLLASSVLE